ncbi:MAG TPA: hypothetical protein EYP16_00820 [Candidatus Atribacteria bacterium]|nr:hypothetical protein [Candidatus Atribacteria bacterium]
MLEQQRGREFLWKFKNRVNIWFQIYTREHSSPEDRTGKSGAATETAFYIKAPVLFGKFDPFNLPGKSDAQEGLLQVMIQDSSR